MSVGLHGYEKVENMMKYVRHLFIRFAMPLHIVFLCCNINKIYKTEYFCKETRSNLHSSNNSLLCSSHEN